MGKKVERRWRQRLGLKAEPPGPDDWVIIARLRADTAAGSSGAKRAVRLLEEAGIHAEAKPYVLPDSDGARGVRGHVGPDAADRVRVAVAVRRRDQPRAEQVLRAQPKAQPITDEELTRLAEEAAPPAAGGDETE